MTNIISRVFEDEAAARYAAERIVFRGVPSRDVKVIAGSDAEATNAKMAQAEVDDGTMSAYASALEKGQAVLVVRATYKPLTAATVVRDLLSKMDTIDVGDVVEDYYRVDGPEVASSVLKEHPLFLTVRFDRTGYSGGPVTKGLGWRMLSQRRARTSAIRGGGFKSRVFWPMPLLSTKQRKKSVISGGRYMSKAFWPMALLSTKPRSNSVIKGGDLPLSRALGWPAVS
ncbi:hypothetical protein [uncultured Tateyamaria sp.]|uniref:hypothetical protein n=1 Tax=uncultured Tateyamaria sp. TaxID=455651 RepID=UPI0026143839|nr:hypothetical protein [uncultured Tateyamaria sp.]